LHVVLSGDVDFHAHVVILWGLKKELWKKVGNAQVPARPDVWFRDSDDFRLRLNISKNWKVWRINEEFRYVGKLPKKYHGAEIGVVVSPDNIIHRMKDGKYRFFTPKF
jgi:hypothetical protein